MEGNRPRPLHWPPAPRYAQAEQPLVHTAWQGYGPLEGGSSCMGAAHTALHAKGGSSGGVALAECSSSTAAHFRPMPLPVAYLQVGQGSPPRCAPGPSQCSLQEEELLGAAHCGLCPCRGFLHVADGAAAAVLPSPRQAEPLWADLWKASPRSGWQRGPGADPEQRFGWQLVWVYAGAAQWLCDPWWPCWQPSATLALCLPLFLDSADGLPLL